MAVNTENTDSCNEEKDKPDWYDDAFEVYSVNSRADTSLGKQADTARDALEAAGVPCFLEFYEDPPECIHSAATHGWRVLVPGRLNMLATNILDRDMFNDEFETLWRSHLEMLTDQELSESAPKDIFCGLFDKIDRVNTAYSDELSQRGLRPSQS